MHEPLDAAQTTTWGCRFWPAASVVIAYASFITLGLSVGFLGVAWPSIRSAFDLPLDAVGTLLIAATMGSIVSSLNGGYVASLIGVGPLLALSSLTTALGLLGYAATPTWWLLVLAGLVSGLGSGTMHVGLNAHFTAQFGARALNWLHACFGVGATFGPLLLTSIIGAGVSWRWAYAAAGGWMLALAASFALTRSRWTGSTQRVREDRERDKGLQSGPETATLPIVWLSLLLFFIYTGVESTAGQWAYSLFTEERAVPETVAAAWMTIYWGALAGGRLVLGSLLDRVGTIRLLRLSMLCVVAGAAMICCPSTAPTSFLGLALMGLAEGPIFPLLVSVTPSRVSAGHVDKAIGFQVAAASLGAATISSLAGVLARRFTLEIVGPFLVLSATGMMIIHEIALRQASDAKGGPGSL